MGWIRSKLREVSHYLIRKRAKAYCNFRFVRTLWLHLKSGFNNVKKCYSAVKGRGLQGINFKFQIRGCTWKTADPSLDFKRRENKLMYSTVQYKTTLSSSNAFARCRLTPYFSRFRTDMKLAANVLKSRFNQRFGIVTTAAVPTLPLTRGKSDRQGRLMFVCTVCLPYPIHHIVTNIVLMRAHIPATPNIGAKWDTKSQKRRASGMLGLVLARPWAQGALYQAGWPGDVARRFTASQQSLVVF